MRDRVVTHGGGVGRGQGKAVRKEPARWPQGHAGQPEALVHRDSGERLSVSRRSGECC